MVFLFHSLIFRKWVIVVTCLIGVASALQSAPASDVLASLDLTRPELAAVAQALRNNDQPAAVAAFAKYLRERRNVHWRENPDGSRKVGLRFDKGAADDAVAGRVNKGAVSPVHAFPNGVIDWSYNATEQSPEYAPNNEWTYYLNRMWLWVSLAGAYTATGDETYAKAFVRQMHSWIDQCPAPGSARQSPGLTWRTLEAGIRMGQTWPDAYWAFLHSPSMSDDDLMALAGSFLDHARYLRACHSRFNWLATEMSGLYVAGCLFPEFREAADWRSFALEQLVTQVKQQFLPDGAQVELSTGYHQVVLDTLLRIVQIARWNDREADLPPGYVGSLEKGYDWLMGVSTPDYFPMKFNDSWMDKGTFKKAVAYFPNRADFRWLATDGQEGREPSQTSYFFNYSGFAVMRSGWDRQGNLAAFRVGPAGGGHQHQDSLDVLLWAYGRELLFNNGGGAYEKSKWRDWGISTYSHNCVIVDGLDQTRVFNWNDLMRDPNMVSQGPIDACWTSTPVFDYATGVYDQGYGPEHRRIAVQRREVLFLKPDLYLVADRLVPADAVPHRYQARWQLLTTKTQLDPATHTLITVDHGVANLAVLPLLAEGLEVAAVSAQETPELLGWNVLRDYVGKGNIPATTLLHTRTGTGPQTLLTLLIPLRPGEANPVKAVSVDAVKQIATVEFSDRRRLSVEYAGELGLKVKELLPDQSEGRAAIVSGQ